jgi:hypothetical protein
MSNIISKSTTHHPAEAWPMFGNVMPTAHAEEQVVKRELNRFTIIIGANLARPFLPASGEARKFWHGGMVIVLALKNGATRVLTAYESEVPDVVKTGLHIVRKMLTQAPVQYKFSGYEVIAKSVYDEPVADLVWEVVYHGK